MFIDPTQIIKKFNLSDGMLVADFGAGSGFYSFEAARAVSPNGKVYSVDVMKDLLTKLLAEAGKQGLRNIEIVWGNIEKLGGTRLRESFLDRVIVSNVFFQVEHREGVVAEIKRVLKKGGRVLLVDWSDSTGSISGGKNFHEEEAKKLFATSGFVLEEVLEAGNSHYALIFKK